MSDELKIEAANALAQLLKDIQSAKDFALDQAPDVIQQMVGYESTVAWAQLALVPLSLILAFIAFRSWKTVSEICRERGARYMNDEEVVPFAVGVVLSLASPLLLILPLALSLPVAIKATFYPKWFVVEQLAKLLS